VFDYEREVKIETVPQRVAHATPQLDEMGVKRELISRSNWPSQAERAWVASGSNPPSRTNPVGRADFASVTWSSHQLQLMPSATIRCQVVEIAAGIAS
jgi:hypothetical protein